MPAPSRDAPRPARPSRRPLTKREGRFHHGDLGWALVEAATQLLEREGPAGVGLRAAARLAGVSHNAPYRHFPDRESMLAAVAAGGLAALADRLEKAAGGHRDARQALAAIAETYLRLAAERPHLFRLMFGPDVADKSRHAAVREAGLRAHRILLDTIAAGQRAGTVRAGDPADLALGLWAAVHGVAALFLDGMLSERARERGGPPGLARLVTEQLRLGLDPRP